MPCSPVPASFLYPCDVTDAEWGVTGAAVAGASAARPTAPLGTAAAGQRHLLRPAHRLCLGYLPRETLGKRCIRRSAGGACTGLAAGPRGLRRSVRRQAGRDPEPSAAIMDSQSVKPRKNRAGSRAMTGVNRSRAGNGICWWTRSAAAVGVCHPGEYLRPGGAPLADRA